MNLNVELKCACGNTARYIDDHGEFCCGICPIKNGRDSIRISDVPQLLSWARITIDYLKNKVGYVCGHVPAGDGIQAMLGPRAPATPEPSGPTEPVGPSQFANPEPPLYCVHCKQLKGEPHSEYCAVKARSLPEGWRTKPDVPHCSVCWFPLDGSGTCERCYRESIS